MNVNEGKAVQAPAGRGEDGGNPNVEKVVETMKSGLSGFRRRLGVWARARRRCWRRSFHLFEKDGDGTGITKEVGTVMRSFSLNVTGTECRPEDQTIEEMENSDEQMGYRGTVQIRKQLMKRTGKVQDVGKQMRPGIDQDSGRQRL